jgi:hypothetical protein
MSSTNEKKHRHHHHHNDASEVFKKKALKAKARRDFIERAVFFLMFALAAVVVVGVFLAYAFG